MAISAFAAVDLGASSGRVMLGLAGPGELRLTEVNRFPNTPVEVADVLHWDVLALYRGVLDGLRAAGRDAGLLHGIGIDAWAVDYGLLDETGALLSNPVHYRDRRTEGRVDEVRARIPAAELYDITGVQLLPINTLFQLVAEMSQPRLGWAATLLLIPDLLAYWLTGERRAEVTNASTTALLDVRTGGWAVPLMTRLGIDARLFPPLQRPGDEIGRLLPAVQTATGLHEPVTVTAVGSHDTASAVVGVPAANPDFAYISCGTWSLVGVEIPKPVLTEASRGANFTNEGGVDGTIRYLRNVMGLWLLQESIRTWNERGLPADLESLLHEAAGVPRFSALVDVNDATFLPPGDMPQRIADACRRTGQTPPPSRGAIVRCILDSLALAYRRTVREAADLAAVNVAVVHLVGGGARNKLLCQLTADACGLPVIAGPVEAAALGNVLVQARSAGVLAGDLFELRGLLRRTVALDHYQPSGDDASWQAAQRRIA
jgi:rhamnulokinase